ncbi:MAG: sulfatase-like hydrolase/transferase [Akkermansiaceae bacterium]
MNRLSALAFLLSLLSISVVAEPAKPTHPNILFLFTDDQRFDTVRSLGNADIQTPNIDRLVKRGTTFTNAYIMGGTSPAVCSPSRAALFSGKTLFNLPNQGKFGFEIPETIPTLPENFRNNGYTTFATGKNEPGIKGHFARSFSDAEHILFKGMTRSQYILPLREFTPDGNYQKQKPITHKGTHSDVMYADACIRFLERQETTTNKPFFAYVAFQTPHDPRQSPPEYGELYPREKMKLPPNYLPEHPFDNGMLRIRDENLAPFPRTEEIVQKHLSDYYACITHTDAQIGRIIEALEKIGKLENTVIVFTADNGLAIGSHGLMGKQNVYDHSVHVPFVIAGPGIPQNEKRDHLIYIYDINPTLCELAGVPTPETVQYKSFLPVLEDAKAKHRDHLFFAFMSWQRAIFDGKYKLIEYCVEGNRTTQLFDLSADPHEINNLASEPEHSQDLKRLRTLLESEKKRLNDGDAGQEFTDAQGKAFWDSYLTTEGR